MATLKDTPFVAWEFSEEEYPLAVVLNELQYKHLQTELATVAAERAMMAVPVDGTIEVYLRTQEYLRGKAEQLTALLMTSDNTKHALMEELKRQMDAQKNDRKPT